MDKETPHIVFRLNRPLDYQMAVNFLQPKPIGGFDFAAEIIKVHPKLEKALSLSEAEKGPFIKKHVDAYYAANKAELFVSKREFQNDWNKAEKDFFQLAGHIFENLSWPSGNYIGFISILPVGPRFLETKEFQSCWLWKEKIVSQVAHELLHFQFYNLVEKLDLSKKYSDNTIWHLSEIFNDIIQSEKKFIELQGFKPKVYYPDHIKHLVKYRSLWQECKSAEKFIKRSLPIIKSDFDRNG